MISRRKLMRVGLGSGLVMLSSRSMAQWPVGYIANDWYPPSTASEVVGVALSSGHIYCRPVYIQEAITVNALGANLTTASAGGHFQLALYNNDSGLSPAINRPGTLVDHTASISTGSTGTASGSLGSNQSLTAGTWYWTALQCDNSTVIFTSYGTGDPIAPYFMGSLTEANIITSSTAVLTGVVAGGVFGSWPSISGLTNESTTNEIPVVAFQVHSVP